MTGAASNHLGNVGGTKVPRNERSREQSFQGTKDLRNESSRERKVPGTKVPYRDFLFFEMKGLGHEKSEYPDP